MQCASKKKEAHGGKIAVKNSGEDLVRQEILPTWATGTGGIRRTKLCTKSACSSGSENMIHPT